MAPIVDDSASTVVGAMPGPPPPPPAPPAEGRLYTLIRGHGTNYL